MKIEKIKPIPKYIQERIHKLDLKYYPEQKWNTRYYSYLTKNDGELVKLTVAVTTRYKKWFCKQVAVRGLNSKKCFVKDIEFHYIAGYRVGWYSEGASKHKPWYEDGKWYTATDGYYNPDARPINNEFVGKIAEFKYSAYNEFKGECIISYLRLYREHPILEMLVKANLHRFIYSKQIVRKCEKDKAFRKWLIKNAIAATTGTVYIAAILKAYKEKIEINTAQSLVALTKELSSGAFDTLKKVIGKDIDKYKKYIIKQNTSNSNYLDYFNACNYLGLDMTLERNLFPHDFKKWHDIRIDEKHSKEAEEDKAKRKELYEKFAIVANKYLPLQKCGNTAFIVVIAKSPAELIQEGYALHHCVGKNGYDQKFIREETLIFFIRNAEQPNVPLVTVEYSLKTNKILQCYADHNQKPSQDITDYVNKKWLPHAKRQLKKIAA